MDSTADINIGTLLGDDELLLGFRFGVYFLTAGLIPNPLDVRFRKVSGLGTSVDTRELREGGQNAYVHQLPEQVRHDNLVLERGMVVGSPLNIEVNVTLSLFTFHPANAMVMLYNDERFPVAAWMLLRTFPVRWSVSDLDAEAGGVVIDTLELAYARMQPVRL
jgi:phage tail-like protein